MCVHNPKHMRDMRLVGWIGYELASELEDVGEQLSAGDFVGH